MDLLAYIQKEVQNTVQDVEKTKKIYFDEEHCAHDVRDKAKDIEARLFFIIFNFIIYLSS